MLVYGEKWYGVIEPLRILCFVGAISSITSLCGTIFQSTGRSNLQFKWALYYSSFLVISFIVGCKWGLMGVVYALFIVSFINFPIGNYLAVRLVDLNLSQFFYALLPASLGCVLMGISVIIIRQTLLLFHFKNLFLLLSICILTGASVYLNFVWFFVPVPEVLEIKNRFKTIF